MADALGIRFAAPDDAPEEQDVVYHASGNAEGLALSLALLRADGVVADVSWYGDAPVTLPLGRFHSRRLTIRSSQVGQLAPARRGVLTAHDRLALAARLLLDPAFDALLSAPRPFTELPALLAASAAGTRDGLCQVLEYEGV